MNEIEALLFGTQEWADNCKNYLLFQAILCFLSLRLFQEFFCFVKWNKIEADEQVMNALSLHIVIAGVWIILSLFWKILVPAFFQQWE